MMIRITWEATCDLCGETTTVSSLGSIPLDPLQGFYGGDHTEYGWVCENSACQRQLKLYRIVAKFMAAVRRGRKS